MMEKVQVKSRSNKKSSLPAKKVSLSVSKRQSETEPAMASSPGSLPPRTDFRPFRDIPYHSPHHSAGDIVQRQQALGNRTGMPQQLKAGIEASSGMRMDDVRVHYNSPHPAKFGALAHTQGNRIHLAPGQERHLPHEAWHVVQQKQGRVRPTGHIGPHLLNNDRALEQEADRKGAEAARGKLSAWPSSLLHSATRPQMVQRMALPLMQAPYSNPAVIQFQTKVTHTSQKYTIPQQTEVVGKEMKAELDPGDAKKGSATSANTKTQTGVMWAIEKKYPNANAIKGHLLNHDLGGQAIAANLFPISGQANTLHSSKVEQPIKKLLYSGYSVHYEVKVGGTPDLTNNASTFQIEVSYTNPNTQILTSLTPTPVEVTSDLSDGSGSFSGSALSLPAAAKNTGTSAKSALTEAKEEAENARDAAKAWNAAPPSVPPSVSAPAQHALGTTILARHMPPLSRTHQPMLGQWATLWATAAQSAEQAVQSVKQWRNQLTLAQKKAVKNWVTRAETACEAAQSAKRAVQSAERADAWKHHENAKDVEAGPLGKMPKDIDKEHENAIKNNILPHTLNNYIDFEHK